ncbi:hypothetical protein BHM03_00009426 [Ensete ventricosum]|nr:hypothetical protein BHM03_00009426 [Ensete ventricosum]
MRLWIAKEEEGSSRVSEDYAWQTMGKGNDVQSREINGDEWRDAIDRRNADGVGNYDIRLEGTIGSDWGLARLYCGCRARVGENEEGNDEVQQVSWCHWGPMVSSCRNNGDRRLREAAAEEEATTTEKGAVGDMAAGGKRLKAVTLGRGCSQSCE